jgi:hypothetical protein
MKFRMVWACLALAACVSAADIGVVEEIIAKVNGDIIIRSELERTRRVAQAEMKARGMKDEEIAKITAEHEKDALRDAIDQLLLVQRGKEIGINVETDVSKYLAKFRSNPASRTPTNFSNTSAKTPGSPSKTSRASGATTI